jgi:RNA polymerase sigma factor (sigma-70 family)
MFNSGENNIDDLWKSFVKGDETCFSQIYKQSINGLMSYGLKFTVDKELINDCLQEVFIDIYAKKKKLGKNIKRIKPYLFVAVRNGIIKRLIKENKFHTVPLEEMNKGIDFNIEYSVEQKLIKKEDLKFVQDELKKAVHDLPPRQKEIIYLKYEEELEYTEIAEIMKISVESARKSMHRAILSLRNSLVDDPIKKINYS